MSKKKKSSKKGKVSRKIKELFRALFRMCYYTVTDIIPIYVLITVFFAKGHLLYALAIAFIAFIIMDIICSIMEDTSVQICKAVSKAKKDRKKQQEKVRKDKEKELKQIENLMLQENSYAKEVEQAEKEYGEFAKELDNSKDRIDKGTYKSLKDVCDKMKEIIEILKSDSEEYHQIRHTFKVYFPEFRKTTQKYISIANSDTLDGENKDEFEELIMQFDKYLDYIKSTINATDKRDLSIGIKSLSKILEAERKKVDDNA